MAEGISFHTAEPFAVKRGGGEFKTLPRTAGARWRARGGCPLCFRERERDTDRQRARALTQEIQGAALCAYAGYAPTQTETPTEADRNIVDLALQSLAKCLAHCVCVEEIDLLSSGEGIPTPSQACCSNTDVGCIIHSFLCESQTKTSSTLPRYGVGFANTSETIKNCRVLRDPMPRGELRMHQERSKEVSRF